MIHKKNNITINKIHRRMLSKIKNKIKTFYGLLKGGKHKDILEIIKRRMYSDVSYYFIKKDLTILDNEPIPEAKINIKLRPYRESDHQYFKNLPLDDMLINANIPTCYVAVTDDDVPCFRQWFMEPKDNDKIQAFFRYNFPLLKADECILERAYAIRKFRGLNIMPRVIYLMEKMALDLGYKWAIGCIPVKNTLSLKAALNAQARPYKLQVTKRRFFIRRTVYIDIPKKLKVQNPWLFPEINTQGKNT